MHYIEMSLIQLLKLNCLVQLCIENYGNFSSILIRNVVNTHLIPSSHTDVYVVINIKMGVTFMSINYKNMLSNYVDIICLVYYIYKYIVY